ncbi:hypothetical protein R3J32_04525 [Xylella fastidiosa subsp. multiplex]|nr:hypothetical protein [Xylella fastidiosa]MDC6416692.1 hypothetical protein [Xylella fastidiosa subsp. multiplex]
MLNVLLNDLIAVPVNPGTDTNGMYPARHAFSGECGFADEESACGFLFGIQLGKFFSSAHPRALL